MILIYGIIVEHMDHKISFDLVDPSMSLYDVMLMVLLLLGALKMYKLCLYYW